MSKAKRELRRRLAREQQAIETRLADAVGPNPAGPVLGRANIGYELTERTRGVAHGGMGMIAKVWARSAWPPRSTTPCTCWPCTGPTTSPTTC
ncbi:MAG: hypothetical protein ABR540_19500 [Acidimicrobiales bacterium]